MSTLERGDQIEADFYQLKAQEWACSPGTAKILIEREMANLADTFKALRGFLNETK